MAKRAPSGDNSIIVVFGDQLDADSAAIGSVSPGDIVFMAESVEESRHVPSHVQRTVLFLSAMRHFAEELRERGIDVEYVELKAARGQSLRALIQAAAQRHRAKAVRCVEPGDWRIRRMLEDLCHEQGIRLELLSDTHFITTPQRFAEWANGRASLTMEFFYREQRRLTGYLMEGAGAKAKPVGGEWNLDHDNRKSFGSRGPSKKIMRPIAFAPDEITKRVIDDVRDVLANLPGEIETFAWPVNRAQALRALKDFLNNRLPEFGPYEDAMWSSEPVVYHSTLSAALNLKLLNPRECCEGAIQEYEKGRASIASVEGFVRQIIGWREFIRGIYMLEGPSYADRNSIDQHGELPSLYWDAKTDMNCMSTCVSQVLRTGYAHHIQRLMVMGNFALISGINPKAISDWYLGMFVDGVDWVTLPNTLGMVMHADARVGSTASGTVGTKPYAASGAYIDKMSDYCRGCRYQPGVKDGERACPFTIFYWDFLIRNRERFAKNQRMAMILKNVDRMTESARATITVSATGLRQKFGIGEISRNR
jgi:deoxyribodipyrimidine photolyase-related protein